MWIKIEALWSLPHHVPSPLLWAHVSRPSCLLELLHQIYHIDHNALSLSPPQPLSCRCHIASSLHGSPQLTINPELPHLQQRHRGKLQGWQLEEATCCGSCHRRSLGGEPSDLATKPHQELGHVKAVGGGDAAITSEQLLVEKANFVAKHKWAFDGCRRQQQWQ